MSLPRLKNPTTAPCPAISLLRISALMYYFKVVLPFMPRSSKTSPSFIFLTKVCLPQTFSCNVAYIEVKATRIGHLELELG
jgi:hypothetical protein